MSVDFATTTVRFFLNTSDVGQIGRVAEGGQAETAAIFYRLPLAVLKDKVDVMFFGKTQSVIAQ